MGLIGETDGLDLGNTDILLVNPRDLDHLGAAGTFTAILVAATSWTIAEGNEAIAILLGLIAVCTQIYQWRRVRKLKRKTEPDADIRLRGS